MTQRRLWKGQMEWNWMVEEFGWIILSPREHTHQHQAYTWADQLTVVAVVAVVEVGEVADVEILTMIEDMIVGTTDMKTMITGTGNVVTYNFCSELDDNSSMGTFKLICIDKNE